jgi:hypothetical protein
MIFSEFVDVTCPTALDFLFLPEYVGVGTGLGNHPRIGLDTGNLE